MVGHSMTLVDVYLALSIAEALFAEKSELNFPSLKRYVFLIFTLINLDMQTLKFPVRKFVEPILEKPAKPLLAPNVPFSGPPLPKSIYR